MQGVENYTLLAQSAPFLHSDQTHVYQLRFNHVRGRSRPPLRKRQNPPRFCSHLCLSRICSWHSQIRIRLAGICRNHTVEERTCIPLRPPFHFLSHLRVCSRGKSCRSCLLTRDELRFTNQLEQTEELAVLQLLLVRLQLLRSAWGGLGTALGDMRRKEWGKDESRIGRFSICVFFTPPERS